MTAATWPRPALGNRLLHVDRASGAFTDHAIGDLVSSNYATVTPHTRTVLLKNIFNDAKVVLVVEHEQLLGVLTKIDLIDYIAATSANT